MLGVAELIYQILFFTLQLPLSSLYTTGFLLTKLDKKHSRVIITKGDVDSNPMKNCCLDTHCNRCCTNTNMVLTTQDIQTIEKLGYSTVFFVFIKNHWIQLKNIQGRCVFHNGTFCTIYDHRPEGCRLYPAVFQKDDRKAILDHDCPQKHCFPITKEKSRQLLRLIQVLEEEREGRKKIRHGNRTDDALSNRSN